MADFGTRDELASLLVGQDTQTLLQTLVDLAEDYAPVYQRLERLRLRDDPVALMAAFFERLASWESDERYVRLQDASAFGRELDVWVMQVQREVLPRFPAEAMMLFAAFIELDRVAFERVDDDGGNVGGAFEVACRLWSIAAKAAGLNAADIASRAMVLRGKDHYGTRALLG